MPAGVSARIFGLFALVAAAFQIALVLGAPWGSLTWGGRFPGVLPSGMRGVAALSAILLLGFTWIVRSRAGHFGAEALQRSRTNIWVVVVYSALGIIANAVTPGTWERRLWLPVVIVMFLTSLHVALSPASDSAISHPDSDSPKRRSSPTDGKDRR